MTIENCTHKDLLTLRREIAAFWGNERVLYAHHPMFVFEFGHSAFVIKEQGQIIAYLFGFITETGLTGYVHLIGVRESHQKTGLGKLLYDHFTSYAKARGCKNLKAITSPSNTASIAFHEKMGMRTSPVYKNYSGEDEDRVIFEKEI